VSSERRKETKADWALITTVLTSTHCTETAPLIAAEHFDKDTSYTVVFTARKSCTEISTAVASVTATSLYTAKLITVTIDIYANRWMLVEQSEEMDHLVDAMEYLWDGVMEKAGSLTGESFCGDGWRLAKVAC
jgi:hypothetical protein